MNTFEEDAENIIKGCNRVILFGCFPWFIILSICGIITLIAKYYGV